MPKLYFLGTGTSTGVPQLGCECRVCRSVDARDHRLRTSVLYETDEGRCLLLDCGPDFRMQMLSLPYRPIHAVLLTHEHYDHVGGLDDLRPYSLFGQVDVYARRDCVQHLLERIPYCFTEHPYPGVPNLVLHELKSGKSIKLAGEEVLPFEVMHGQLPILGFRIGQMVYITDMSQMDMLTIQLLKGIKVLVLNALRVGKPHHSHQRLEDALNWIEKIKPESCYLIHMSHQIGLHADVEASLPHNVHLAYDGLQIEW